MSAWSFYKIVLHIVFMRSFVSLGRLTRYLGLICHSLLCSYPVYRIRSANFADRGTKTHLDGSKYLEDMHEW